TIPITSNGGNSAVQVIMIVPDPTLSLTPTSLSFGETNTQSSFSVNNTGGGNLNWNVVLNYPAWLSLQPLNGTTTNGNPSTVFVTVDRQSRLVARVPDNYSFNVIVTSNGGTSIIPISMTVPGPSLSVNPTRLDFGTTTTPRTFRITNTGGGTLSWTASSNRAWAYFGIANDQFVRQIQGTIGPYGFEDVSVYINWGNNKAGDYTGLISITSDPTSGGSAEVDLFMTVPNNIPNNPNIK
ncbi:MAG: hypothetical protein QG641_2655, partial [Candidatus Poribacteria bacterium]|nr:hypothetical protein [Candidatus Poribacteria bacterium]